MKTERKTAFNCSLFHWIIANLCGFTETNVPEKSYHVNNDIRTFKDIVSNKILIGGFY